MSIRTAGMADSVTRARERKWDQRFMNMAREAARWSKDPSTHVGAVLVSAPARVVLSTGFNGMPRRMNDVYLDREQKLSRTVHAEMNAILNCRAGGFVRAEDFPVLYVTHPPCDRCAVHLIQFGVGRVVISVQDRPLSPAWDQSLQAASQYFEEAHVLVDLLMPGEDHVQA